MTPDSADSIDDAKTLRAASSFDSESWQPPYVPSPQGNEVASPQLEPRHGTDYGFPPTQTPPAGSG